jgi:prepilin-type processing-associated H-X9-DG protein
MPDMSGRGLAISDAYTQDDTLGSNWRGYGPVTQFDYARHRGKINVVFVDGHAETMSMPTSTKDHGDFDRIGLTRGIFQ